MTVIVDYYQPTCDEKTFQSFSIGCVHFILGASGAIFHFYFIFDEIHVNKQKSPRRAPRLTALLGLFCLPMSHKKDARLTGLKSFFFLYIMPEIRLYKRIFRDIVKLIQHFCINLLVPSLKK